MPKESIQNSPSLQIWLGTVSPLIDDGHFKDAEAELLKVIRAYPHASDAYRLLVKVEQQLGKAGRVKVTLSQLCSLEPENASLWCDLGDISYFLSDWDQSTEAYKRAVELAPGDRHYLARLAYSQLAGQMFVEVDTTRKKLLENHGDFRLTHLIDGHVYKASGKLEEAKKAYARAVEIDPEFSEAIFNLVELKSPAPGDRFTKRIKELLKEPLMADSDKAHLHFALARIFEADGRFDEAFENYRYANQSLQKSMARKGLVYDPQLTEKQISEIIAAYPIEAFQNPITPLEVDLTPIFIVGMPRSGTTLVEQILSSHPSVSAGGEMTIAQTCNRRYLQKKHALQAGPLSTRDQVAHSNLLMEIRECYVDYLFAHDLDRAYVTDKLPGNFEILGFIKSIFPNAIIVHCRRNLVATCWSLYASNFGEHDPYYTSLEHLAHYYGQYRRLVAHWASVLHPPMIEVDYEALVSSPAKAIRHLLAECGLPWDERCEHFSTNQRPVITASFGQVRQGIYTTSINKWKNYEPYVQELLEWPDS